MYGAPTDVKIKKLSQSGNDEETSNVAVYQASFTTLTPAMRERLVLGVMKPTEPNSFLRIFIFHIFFSSDRKAYISAAIVGDGLFLLITTTTSVRFGKLEGSLRKIAQSFSAIPAPRSNFNQRK